MQVATGSSETVEARDDQSVTFAQPVEAFFKRSAVVARRPGDFLREYFFAPRVGELLKLEVEVLGAADARVSGGAHVLVLNVSFRSAPTTACTRRRGYSRLIRMTSALPPCPAAPIICASIVAREVRLRLCE